MFLTYLFWKNYLQFTFTLKVSYFANISIIFLINLSTVLNKHFISLV